MAFTGPLSQLDVFHAFAQAIIAMTDLPDCPDSLP